MKLKINDRFYLRGTSPLGIFNTIIGALFNRVLIRCVDIDTNKTVSWFIDKGTSHPPQSASCPESKTTSPTLGK